jgi:hypothetical protein
MPITAETARELFAKLEQGNGEAFFDHVADDVDWTVFGTHPLAGRYRGKAAFRAATFERLNSVLKDGPQLRVVDLLMAEGWAVVELRSDAVAKNGMRFDNRYCWLVRFVGPTIAEVRAYLDSALVQRVFDENRVAA